MGIYRELFGWKNISDAMGITKFTRRQKKAARNINACSSYQWGYVNSWYDDHDMSARAYILSPKELFQDVYYESLHNIYDDGLCVFGGETESFLKDIRFCGKTFLKKATLYCIVKFLDDAVPEVALDKSDYVHVANELIALKMEIEKETEKEKI